jgi:galactokinase
MLERAHLGDYSADGRVLPALESGGIRPSVPRVEWSAMPRRCTVFAPGRVNLMGEHTDYSGGLVLPAAIAFGISLRGVEAERLTVRSTALAGAVELTEEGEPAATMPGWGRYVEAIAALLTDCGRPPVWLDATVESTVPIGAGLSSSAALTVAIALALCRVAEFELAPLELAKLAQAAELRAVGVPCGLMDPAASLLGRRGHALLLDCGSEHWRTVKLPSDFAIVVLNSGTRHSLEHSGYATRRAELERALPALDGRRPAEVGTEEALTAARRAGVDDVAISRLRHVVSENARVTELVAALEAPVTDRELVGQIMRASHASQRDDFAVSTTEIDTLVEIAYEHRAIGARLTGGGFGGSVVALVSQMETDDFIDGVEAAYAERTGRVGAAYLCPTADGAAELDGSAG